MKKFIAILMVILLVGSFTTAFATEETKTFPVSITIEAVTGSKPMVSTRDILGEALGMSIPEYTLVFVEDEKENQLVIQWARLDGKFEYWNEPVDAFEENPEDYDNAFRIAVCSFAEMCTNHYVILLYVDASGNVYMLSPLAEENIEEKIYTSYEDFQLYVMLDSVQ